MGQIGTQLTKVCKVCGEQKDIDQFTKNKQTADGLHTKCRSCLSEHKAQDYKDRWFVYQARLKKAECKKKGIPYDLTPEYLESIFTERCPVFNEPFVRFDKTHSYSPALDRVDPTKGYTKDNVVYISARANRIKYDATIEEMENILKYMLTYQKTSV